MMRDVQAPAYAKSTLRKDLDDLGKRAITEQKAAAKLIEEAGKAAALAAVAAAVAAGKKVAVLEVPINGEGSLVKAINKALTSAPGGGAEVAFLGVSSNKKDKVGICGGRRRAACVTLPTLFTALLKSLDSLLRPLCVSRSSLSQASRPQASLRASKRPNGPLLLSLLSEAKREAKTTLQWVRLLETRLWCRRFLQLQMALLRASTDGALIVVPAAKLLNYSSSSLDLWRAIHFIC